MVNCPECGCDRFKCKDYEKVTREKEYITKRLREISAESGVAKANSWLAQVKLEDSMRYLQRKTKKQAEVITRLENKLKKLGQQPYREDNNVHSQDCSRYNWHNADDQCNGSKCEKK